MFSLPSAPATDIDANHTTSEENTVSSMQRGISDMYTIAEIFIEMPCDVYNQSCTWSNYKYHNTAKLLVACTPNGAICFASPLYVG